ncbi:uncharacterized [Tachysurus ichikawai]
MILLSNYSSNPFFDQHCRHIVYHMQHLCQGNSFKDILLNSRRQVLGLICNRCCSACPPSGAVTSSASNNAACFSIIAATAPLSYSAEAAMVTAVHSHSAPKSAKFWTKRTSSSAVTISTTNASGTSFSTASHRSSVPLSITSASTNPAWTAAKR